MREWIMHNLWQSVLLFAHVLSCQPRAAMQRRHHLQFMYLDSMLLISYR